ncbi:hypothetical protein E2K98_14430 [Bacillus salipaludis]|uniref:Flavoprotein n=1 Tax=Bacillus salipaludis TaxID=2547811 RepID=A0A4R5VSP5_9BACI|nr:hypothetical protein [Bacillus salipaludis]TDK60911.1 hypothetical protein E2K98_14430 [Bacillus salipaludis]
MDLNETVKQIVQKVVEDYVKQLSQHQGRKPITILLGYQTINQTEILEAVSTLQQSYDVKVLLTKEWELSELNETKYILMEDSTQQALMEIINQTSILVIPAASYQLLTKLALSIDDEAAVWFTIQTQLLGKQIVIASDQVEPNVYQQILAPPSVLERLQGYIRQIQTDQVKWVPLRKLVQTVEQQMIDNEDKQPLILGKHIEKAYQEGLKEIATPFKSRITPVAKDLAKEFNIKISPLRG